MRISAFFAMVFVTVFAVACSSSDSGSDKPDGAIPASDGIVPAGDTIIPSGDGTTPETDAQVILEDGATPSGKCTNVDDLKLIDSEEKRDAVTAKAKTCGLGCLTNADKTACATECLKKETGLSEGCTTCYVGIILCSMDNCVAHCALNPDSEACLKCMNGENPNKVNCYAQFYECSGLTPPTPPTN